MLDGMPAPERETCKCSGCGDPIDTLMADHICRGCLPRLGVAVRDGRVHVTLAGASLRELSPSESAVLFSQLAPAAMAPPAVVASPVAPPGAPAAPSSGAAKPGAPPSPPGGVASPFGPMTMPTMPRSVAEEAGLPMRDLIAKMRQDASAQIAEEDKRLIELRARAALDEEAASKPGATT